MKAPEPYLVWREPGSSSEGDAAGAKDGEIIDASGVNRWLRYGAILTLVLIVLPPIPYVLSPLWVLALATGYAAAVLIAVIMLLPLRSIAQWPGKRISVARHKWLAELALAMSLLHTVLFLVTDTLTLEYLKLSQPRFMVAGNVGLILLALLVVTSLERARVRLFGSNFRFRPIHLIGSIVLVVLVAAHMAGSAVWIAHPLKVGVTALVAAILVAATLRRPTAHEESPAPAPEPRGNGDSVHPAREGAP